MQNVSNQLSESTTQLASSVFATSSVVGRFSRLAAVLMGDQRNARPASDSYPPLPTLDTLRNDTVAFT